MVVAVVNDGRHACARSRATRPRSTSMLNYRALVLPAGQFGPKMKWRLGPDSGVAAASRPSGGNGFSRQGYEEHFEYAKREHNISAPSAYDWRS